MECEETEVHTEDTTNLGYTILKDPSASTAHHFMANVNTNPDSLHYTTINGHKETVNVILQPIGKVPCCKHKEDMGNGRVKLKKKSPMKAQEDDEKVWTKEKVFLLIECYMRYLKECRRGEEKLGWLAARDHFSNNSYNFTWEEIRKKWYYLFERFRTVLERQQRSGSSKVNWIYFQKMKEALEGDPRVFPDDDDDDDHSEPSITSHTLYTGNKSTIRRIRGRSLKKVDSGIPSFKTLIQTNLKLCSLLEENISIMKEEIQARIQERESTREEEQIEREREREERKIEREERRHEREREREEMQIEREETRKFREELLRLLALR